MTDDNISDISQRGATAMKDDMNAVFGIVEDCGNGEWLWVQPGKFRMAVGGPGSLTYSDRASAERDAEKIRAERPGSNLTVVVTTPAAEDEGRRFSSLAESNGIEGAIWESVNAFNRAQLSLGDPPATCEEIIEALAHAVHYVLVFLAEPDFGYAEPDEKDPPDVTRLEKVDYGDDIVLADRFAEELRTRPTGCRKGEATAHDRRQHHRHQRGITPAGFAHALPTGWWRSPPAALDVAPRRCGKVSQHYRLQTDRRTRHHGPDC